MNDVREKLARSVEKKLDFGGQCQDGSIFFFYAHTVQINERSIVGMGKEIFIDTIKEIREYPNN